MAWWPTGPWTKPWAPRRLTELAATTWTWLNLTAANVVSGRWGKTFTLTLTRDTEKITQILSVAAIDGVASGWTLLDNFDRYPEGSLAGQGNWANLHFAQGETALIAVTNGNHFLTTSAGDVMGVFPLTGNNIITEGQERTLFDDFYLSKSGYLTTVPRAYGMTTPVAAPPTLSIGLVGGQIEITWSGGTLESSTRARRPSGNNGPAKGPITIPCSAGVWFGSIAIWSAWMSSTLSATATRRIPWTIANTYWNRSTPPRAARWIRNPGLSPRKTPRCPTLTATSSSAARSRATSRATAR